MLLEQTEGLRAVGRGFSHSFLPHFPLEVGREIAHHPGLVDRELSHFLLPLSFQTPTPERGDMDEFAGFVCRKVKSDSFML